jgi:hypothetical protein
MILAEILTGQSGRDSITLAPLINFRKAIKRKSQI